MQTKLRMKGGVKRILNKAGAFPMIRSLYRGLSPAVRAARRADRALYSPFIKPGDLVFDVGATLGQKSEVFRQCGGRAIGVEPNALCEPTLRHLFGADSGFILVPKALAATEGKMVLHFAGTSSTASLRQDWAWLGIEGEPGEAEVDVTTLDQLIRRYGVPAFCKIDVEGFEPEVLRGLSQPIPCLSFEYHLEEADRFLACLDHLAGFSDMRVNVIPMSGAAFVLGEWVKPTDLKLSELPPEGDCFVMTPALQ